MTLTDAMYFKKISVMKLAKLAKIHPSYISHFRAGNRIPTPKQGKAIEKILETPIEWPETKK